MQGDLFNVDPITPKKPESGKRCRNCQFCYKHQYGKMFYCEKQKDKKTSYGHKKIKANDAACELFKSDKE